MKLCLVIAALLAAGLSGSAAQNAILENACGHPASLAAKRCLVNTGQQSPSPRAGVAGRPLSSFSANRSAAEFLLQSQQVAQAIPFLEQARKADPANYANNFDLALAYFTTRAFARSRDLVTNMLRQSQSAELHNLLADVAEAQGQFNEAAREFETAARLDPSEKNLFDLGNDLLAHRQYTPALQVFNFATGRHPQSSRLWVGLGVAHYSLGEYDQAVETLCHAVDLAPDDSRALEFLGKMPGVSPRYTADVTRRLQHFATVYPQSAPANYYYAMSLLDPSSGSPGTPARHSAQNYLQRAVSVMPDFGEAHLALGTLFEDQRRDPDALREYRLAVSANPGLAKAHYRLARLYRKMGETALAEKELAKMTQVKDGSANVKP